jgi:hypothetical protein
VLPVCADQGEYAAVLQRHCTIAVSFPGSLIWLLAGAIWQLPALGSALLAACACLRLQPGCKEQPQLLRGERVQVQLLGSCHRPRLGRLQRVQDGARRL